jgi:hypothetical protein
MATRPSEATPGWAPADVADRVEPDGARKLSGYAPGEPLPAQILNWLLYSISLWLAYFAGFNEKVNVTGTRPITAADDGRLLRLDSSGGAFNLTLPDPTTVSGLRLQLKDIGGVLSTHAVTLVRFGSEQIEGLAANFVLDANRGTWVLYCNGTGYEFH